MIHVTRQAAPCYSVRIDWSLSQEPSAKKARRPLSKVIANKLRDSPLKQARNSIKVRGAYIHATPACTVHALHRRILSAVLYIHVHVYTCMCTILVRVMVYDTVM